MPRRTVGVELGADAIRLVRIVGGWRQPRIDGWQVRPLPPAGRPDHRPATLQALRELGAAGWFKADQVIIALPGDQVISRVVTVPFQDPQKVMQVLGYEVESLLPFELEEVVISPAALHATPAGGSRVLAVALPKNRLRAVLELVTEAGLDPSAVEIGPAGLARVARAAFAPPGGLSPTTVSVIELAQTGATIAFCRDGQLTQFRTLSTPVDDEALLAELKRATHFYELDERAEVTDFFLCGARALEPSAAALVGRLGEQLGARRLEELPAWLQPHGVDPATLLSLAQAIGAALRPPDERLNFRQAEFMSPRERSRARSRSVGVVAAIVALVVLGGANLFTHYYVKERAYTTLKSDQRERFTQTFSDVRVVVDELEQAKIAMRALSRRADFLGDGELSALVVLDRLTTGVETLPELKLDRLQIVGNDVRFEGEVASFEAVDRVRDFLRQLDSATQVAISDARLSADQERVRFKATLLFAPARQAGGPAAGSGTEQAG